MTRAGGTRRRRPACPADPRAGRRAEIGADGARFAFDSETPRHKVWLDPYRIADRLVTNGEWLRFHRRWRLPHRRPCGCREGWSTCQAEDWQAPLHWHRRDGAWFQFGLAGLQPLDPGAPVRHVSWYEAEAFARWAERAAADRGGMGSAPAGCPVSVTPRTWPGNGPAAPTGPIPASGPGKARSASTTASSWWGR